MIGRRLTWPLLFGLLAAAPGFAQYFTNVTDEVGLTDTPGFRLSIGDINGDLYPDILLHQRSDWEGEDCLNRQYLWLNVPGSEPTDPHSRSFVDWTTESRIRRNRRGTMAGRHSDSGIFADVDNDGDQDLFLVVYLHRSYTMFFNTNDLFLNDGDGVFRLAPPSPFHLEPVYNTAGAVWADINNDSAIDLFIGNWYFNDLPSTDQLYQGHGDASFTNITASAGIDAAQTAIYGLASWDWNDDGLMDLFAQSYSHTASGVQSRHWENNGDGTFTQVQASSGYNDYSGFGSGRASFGSMPRDYDNDGDTDFMEIWTHGTGDGATGIHTTVATYDSGVYSWDFARVYDRATEDPDTSHHGDHYMTWLDFDNDGLVDFALTESGYSNNRFYVFKQAADHTFSPITLASGLNTINDANLPSHNVLAMDYDLDGDEDLLVGIGDNTNGIQMWRNDVGTLNDWVVITLEGGGMPGFANRSAIGGRAEVTAGGLTQMREVYAGNGHHGPQVPLSMHFGLGTAAALDNVTITWPNADRTTVEYSNLPVRRFYHIREICELEEPLLYAVKNGNDVDLVWDEGEVVWWWNFFRDTNVDPATWGAPLIQWMDDPDPSTPGVPWTDVDALLDPTLTFYQSTAFNDCGESPLF